MPDPPACSNAPALPMGAISVPSAWGYLAAAARASGAERHDADPNHQGTAVLRRYDAFKFTCLLPCPAQIDADHFRQHLLEVHASLVASVAPALRVQRYVQTHRIPSVAIDGMVAQRGWSANPYSEMTEIWWRSELDMLEAMQSEEGQRAGQLLAEDEAKITDSNVIVWAGQEHELVLPLPRLQ